MALRRRGHTQTREGLPQGAWAQAGGVRESFLEEVEKTEESPSLPSWLLVKGRCRQARRKIFNKNKQTKRSPWGDGQYLLPCGCVLLGRDRGSGRWRQLSTQTGWDLASWMDADWKWKPGPHDGGSGGSTALDSPKQAKRAGTARGPVFFQSSWASQRMEVQIHFTVCAKKPTKIFLSI